MPTSVPRKLRQHTQAATKNPASFPAGEGGKEARRKIPREGMTTSFPRELTCGSTPSGPAHENPRSFLGNVRTVGEGEELGAARPYCRQVTIAFLAEDRSCAEGIQHDKFPCGAVRVRSRRQSRIRGGATGLLRARSKMSRCRDGGD